jgi:hypothetical protein
MTRPISSTPDRQKICAEIHPQSLCRAVFSAPERLWISSRIISTFVDQFMRTDVLEITRLNQAEQWREGGSKAVGICVFREWVFRQTSNRSMITYVCMLSNSARHEAGIISVLVTGSGRINVCAIAPEFAKGRSVPTLRFGHFPALCLAAQRRQPRERKRDHNHSNSEYGGIIAPTLRCKRLAFAVPRSDESA